MTRDELYRKRMMFQIYSSRNQMPKFETNANNEPLKHSATNDYLEYRKKVAAGVRIQKENNKSNLFNVTEANEQYYQDLMDQNIIIHAGTYKPDGTHKYVAVLPDFWGKGKHRYFYTQQEWDNAKKDLKNRALAEAGQKAFENSQKNRNVTIAQSGREAAIRNSQGGSKEDASDITNRVKNYSALKKEYEKNADYAKNAGADRAANEVANNKTPYRGADWEKNSKANPEERRGHKEGILGTMESNKNAKERAERQAINDANWEKNSKANPEERRGHKEGILGTMESNKNAKERAEREAAIRNSQGGSKEDASDITNRVKNYSALKKEYEKNADYAKNAGADRAANEVANNKTPYRGADWEKNSKANPEERRGHKEGILGTMESNKNAKERAERQAINDANWEKNAAAAGKAEAARGNKESAIGRNANRENAKNRGEEEYAEEFANGPQSGSSNAARAEGEGYDRYKKDLAEREAFREESEREALNYQERESNKKESVASRKNEAQRALKDTASGIANSKNPAKEIASNKTYSKYIDDIVSLIDSGAAEIGSDGTIHIDKTKNPKAVYKIINDDVVALNTELLKNGMTQRSINAAVMDEIEKRAKASKENKGQSGIESFMKGSKAKKGVSTLMQNSKSIKNDRSKAMSANQSGSGNAAAAEGERRDIERERAAWEEEQRRVDAYDRNNGKKKYASARHDGLEYGITTSDDISPDQEYLNFRAKVEAGMKHFGMSKGLISIPVNQALAHAGTAHI